MTDKPSMFESYEQRHDLVQTFELCLYALALILFLAGLLTHDFSLPWALLLLALGAAAFFWGRYLEWRLENPRGNAFDHWLLTGEFKDEDD